MRIVCVGGGPAGLYFALLMKRLDPRHEVTVYERNAQDVTHGFGVTFWDELQAVLYQHDPESAAEFERVAFQWRDQEVVLADGPTMTSSGSGYGIDRHVLVHLLTERARELGVDLQFGHEVDPAEVVVGADLVVASDGVRSRMRAQHAEVFGPSLTVGTNKYVWLGTSKVFTAFTYAFVETAAGWLWCYAYGYSDDRSTFIVECAPDTWTGLGLDRMGAPEALELLQGLFARQLEGHPLIVPPGATEVPWVNWTMVTNQTWHHDNVVLMGDAAHTTHFSVGMGTQLALEDAISLATAFSRTDDIPTALRDYESDRRAGIVVPQREAYFSARWFETVPRYLPLPPEDFATTLHRRRSSVLAQLPPKLFLLLQRPFQQSQGLRRAWERLQTGRLALQQRGR